MKCKMCNQDKPKDDHDEFSATVVCYDCFCKTLIKDWEKVE